MAPAGNTSCSFAPAAAGPGACLERLEGRILLGASAVTDDLVFLHHSVGQNWLDHSLDAALLAKGYVDERNDITYGTDVAPDPGRPDSLAEVPGDLTDMWHWVLWFNDYLGSVRAQDCADGQNRIILFKSCYPNSEIYEDGTEPGDPLGGYETTANYRAVYRHPGGAGGTYSHGGATYHALEDVFAANPDTLFVAVTSPPRHYAPWDAGDYADSVLRAARARAFDNWLKGEWLSGYQAAHPGLNNVAVFDLFDLLAYPAGHASYPNRLRAEYGGAGDDSHPNDTANGDLTAAFATGGGNFLDAAWSAYLAAGAAVVLAAPAAAVDVSQGTPYGIVWTGGRAGETVDVWSLGPAGWARIAAARPAADGGCTWATDTLAPGWYGLAGGVSGAGGDYVAYSPGKVRVLPPLPTPAPGAAATPGLAADEGAIGVSLWVEIGLDEPASPAPSSRAEPPGAARSSGPAGGVSPDSRDRQDAPREPPAGDSAGIAPHAQASLPPPGPSAAADPEGSLSLLSASAGLAVGLAEPLTAPAGGRVREQPR